ncbi:MAG TPA: bifunctional glutamate N-acetyltransferase/amino-acid acetyltransferase ArgJ [Actinomycetota bacterium]|nr:bifunctional glutamate N-acetyltransferase/amino-acid acetyltransferase ArgJ [Actinomycetota bacterium]
MSVTYPRGFLAAGVAAGMKPSGRPDLGLLVADRPCAAAGLFTTNRVQAAPVRLSRARLEASGGRAVGVLVNSGQANAATGPRGEEDARTATARAAELLGADPEELLACSTGVIGEPLHLDLLLAALPGLVASLSEDGGSAFARAIMTTDTLSKEARAEAGRIRVGGCAKGVGMVSPDLATMLAFLTTDARVAPEHLRALARATLEPRFEALTVDGCRSTNDTVLVFASGAAGGDPVEPGTRAWSALEEAFVRAGSSLVAQLARDAEGATRVLLIDVEGARSDEDARRAAKAVADSPLVKTAAFGGDPNPGRILQAVGASGAEVDPDRIDVWVGPVRVVEGGVIPPAYFETKGEEARGAMAGPEVRIRVSLGDGPGRSRALGCDLSYEYVRINGEYTT